MSLLTMTLDAYIAKFPGVAVTLLIDIAIPIITLLRNKKERQSSYEIPIIIILLLVFNACFSYFAGIFSFFKIEDKSIFPYQYIWGAAFIIAVIFEVSVFVYLRHKAKNRDRKPVLTMSCSPNEYQDILINSEKGANTIRLMPKRLSVMFKSQEMIEYIAESRYGRESEYFKVYVDIHDERKKSFHDALIGNTKIYELHNKNELIKYIKNRKHAGVDEVQKKYLLEMINEWKRIISTYHESYHVRLTDERIPFKYEIINDDRLIIHEVVGMKAKGRFNGLMIQDADSVKRVKNDFDLIWGNVDREYIGYQNIINWIDVTLLPLLDE